MKDNVIQRLFRRYFIDAMGAMALGLFSSLIIGLILSQLSLLPVLSFLKPFSEVLAANSPVVGGAIGAAVAWGLKAKPLVIFSAMPPAPTVIRWAGPSGFCRRHCRRGMWVFDCRQNKG